MYTDRRMLKEQKALYISPWSPTLTMFALRQASRMAPRVAARTTGSFQQQLQSSKLDFLEIRLRGGGGFLFDWRPC